MSIEIYRKQKAQKNEEKKKTSRQPSPGRPGDAIGVLVRYRKFYAVILEKIRAKDRVSELPHPETCLVPGCIKEGWNPCV